MEVNSGHLMVKICGLTTFEDAMAALEAGADMLGFNFFPASKRYIQPHRCAEIIARLKSTQLRFITVGVFVNAGLEYMRATLDECSLDLAQLSGDETPETLKGLNRSGYKALRIKAGEDVDELLRVYPPRMDAPAYLVDAYSPGEFGGTGFRADWSQAAALSSRMPILLAGGLTPENVEAAVARVNPWGVDVASGVEATPGVKDREKMAQFVQAARRAGELSSQGVNNVIYETRK